MQSSQRSKGWVPAVTALGGALVVFSGCGHSTRSDSTATGSTSRAGETATTTCVSTTEIHGAGFIGGRPVAINATGQVAGNGTFESGSGGHAFFWDGETVFDLGTLGGTKSSAVAINDNGWVAGDADTAGANYETHAVVWHDGTMVDLGTLGGNWSVARSMNNAGQIVGPLATVNERNP